MAMENLLFVAFHLLLCVYSTDGAVQDFCVADVAFPESPAGYLCKNQSMVTVDDFVFSIKNPGTIQPPFSVGVVGGFAPRFPGVNGLGIAVARVDIEVNGTVPLHSHPHATELIVVISGSVVSGFITAGDDVYLKTLSVGDTMVMPQGLLHFQVNAANSTVTFFSTYNSQSPGLQTTPFSMFRNDLSSKLLEKVTLIDERQVRKLKAVFGGTG